MRKKIEILAISQKIIEDGCEVEFGIKIGDTPYNLKYAIHGEGIKSVPLRCDPIVVTFLNYALYYGMDICSEYPISEKLYYQIKNHIIPHVNYANPEKTTTIDICMPTTSEKYAGTWRGTGVSLGVDSFASIHEYTDEDMPEEYRITHLVHMKVGAHHGMIGYFDGIVEEDLFKKENSKVCKYCQENNYKIITIESNLYEICSKEFDWDFDDVHTTHNLGTMLLVQNYFDKYYYASSRPMEDMSINIRSLQSYYERWLMPLISTENIEFYSANKSMERIDKIKYISQYPDTYDNLHVCWKSEGNCGECDKCIRTLVWMDFLGILDKYKNSFDVEGYYSNKKKHLRRVVAMRLITAPYQKIYKYMKENRIKRPNLLAVNLTRIMICAEKIKKYGIKKLFNIKKR